MPYFKNPPGPTPCEELPQPQSVLDQINKTRADLDRNPSKRKPSDEVAGSKIHLSNYFTHIETTINLSYFKVSKRSSISDRSNQIKSILY